MKIIGLFLVAVFILVGCGDGDNDKTIESNSSITITSNDVCKLMNPKDVEGIVGKELFLSPDKKHKFNNARVCSYTNKSGYPYITLTLYFNEKGEEVSYFAPPNDVFNSYIKELDTTPNKTIAVISKETKNTIELLAQSDKRVVALTLFNVKADDGSENQKLLIREIQNIANQAKELK